MPRKYDFEEMMNKWGEFARKFDSQTSSECLSTIQVIDFVDGLLEDTERRKVIDHLLHCNHCVSTVASAFRIKEEISRGISIRPIKDKTKSFDIEVIDDMSRSQDSWFHSHEQGQPLAAEGNDDLRVMIIESNEVKDVIFKVDGKLIVDDEGQLSISITAPDESYDGKNMQIYWANDEGKIEFLGDISVVGKEAFGVFQTQLEPGSEVPVERITATIAKA